MLPEALAAPARTDDAPVTVLVGGILAALAVVGPAAWLYALVQSPLPLLVAPFVVLPGLVLLGYEVRVVGAGVEGEPASPSFVDWAGLLRRGVGSVGMALGYLLPALVVGVAALAVAYAVTAGLVAAPGWTAPLSALVAFLTVGANALAFLYVRPAGLAVYAATGSLGAAFSPSAVGAVAGSGHYAVGWALATAGLTAGTLVAGPLAVVLVGFPFLFYLRVVVHSLYGRSAAEALADPTADEAPPDPARTPESTPSAPAEASPAVQTGRGLPVPTAGTDGDEATAADVGAAASRAVDPDGFEWGRTAE